jgi:hypothetical protein
MLLTRTECSKHLSAWQAGETYVSSNKAIPSLCCGSIVYRKVHLRFQPSRGNKSRLKDHAAWKKFTFLGLLAAKSGMGALEPVVDATDFWRTFSASLELLRHITKIQRYCHAYLFIRDLYFCKCIIFFNSWANNLTCTSCRTYTLVCDRPNLGKCWTA